MTLKTTVTADGYLDLGDAARAAGFEPGTVVEIIATRAGSLILAIDDAPTIENVLYRPLPSLPASTVALAVDEKRCPHHGSHPRTVEHYYPRPKNRDGLDSVCRQTVRDRAREGMRRLYARQRAERQEAAG